jgi:hypothetical protein
MTSFKHATLQAHAIGNSQDALCQLSLANHEYNILQPRLGACLLSQVMALLLEWFVDDSYGTGA